MNKLCLPMDNTEKGQEKTKTASIKGISLMNKLEGILRSGHISKIKPVPSVAESLQSTLTQDRHTAAILMNMSEDENPDTQGMDQFLPSNLTAIIPRKS